MLDRNQIEARHKRQAAMHEAGHTIVAQAKGIVALNPSIRRNRTTNSFDEKTWAGSTGFIPGPGAGMAFGIAGAIAEMIYEDPDFFTDVETGDPASLIDEITEQWELGLIGLSDSDQRCIQRDESTNTRTAVGEVLTILREHKGDFDTLVDVLMQFPEEEEE